MIALIYSIINEGRIDPVLYKNITPEYFIGDVAKYYTWILEFYNEYKQVPSKQAFEEKFNIKIEDTPDPLEYYVDKFAQYYDTIRVQEFATKIVHKLADIKDKKQIQELMSFIATASKQFTEQIIKQVPVTPVSDVLRDYVKEEIRPILEFPWQFINNLTGGIKQSEFWVIVGRPNVGKTYIALAILKSWFKKGCPYPVIIFSPEMVTSSLLERLLAIIYGFNPDLLKFRTNEAKQFVSQKIHEWEGLPFYIFDKVHDVNQVELYISYYKPKLVLIDSVYLLRDNTIQSSKSALWETIAAVLSKLRLFALKYNIALVVTSQLSRNIGEFSPVASLNDLSYTDVFSQLADYVLGITMTQELKEQKLRQIKIMKARHSSQTSMTINFKFQPQIDFTEIGQVSSIQLSDNQEQSDNLIDY